MREDRREHEEEAEVVPASGTGFGMAYIQKDRRGGIAASMRRRLKEMGTER